MRRRRTLHAALALVVLAAPAVTATSAVAADAPAAPVLEETRCDIAAQTAGASVRVGTVSEDLTSGLYDTGGLIPHTQVDDTWTVPAKTPVDAYSIAKHPAWLTPVASNWINARTTYASGGTAGPIELGPVEAVLGPVGDTVTISPPDAGPLLATKTTFRATFDIPRQSYLNRLELNYAADNGVTFLLNGVPIGGYDPPVADPTAFQQERSLVYAGPLLVEGTNVLDAAVTDYGVATGLLVRGGYRGCQVQWVEPGICLEIGDTSVVAYAPAPIDLNTGGSNGSRDAIGTVDGKWRSVRTGVAQDAYSVTPYPGWFNALSTANWIHETRTPTTGGIGRTYVYEVRFTVGSGATYSDLDLRWAADDTARFSINGTPIPTVGSFRTLTPLHWVGPLNAGTNVLRAEVVDSGLVASGLLVEGGARVCYNAS